MRRHADEPGGGGSDLGWMFEASRDELAVPVPAYVATSRGRRPQRGRRRGGWAATAAAGRAKKRSGMSVTSMTSALIAASMFLHELVAKGLSNAIVLFVLVIPPWTVLYIAVHRWAHKIKREETLELFFKGFGPGFLLLLFTEMVAFLTTLAYYCYGPGTDCSTTIDLLRNIEGLPDFLIKEPLQGLVFAFVLSFFTAGCLEESTKLFFVSNAVEFVLYAPQKVSSASASSASSAPSAPSASSASPTSGQSVVSSPATGVPSAEPNMSLSLFGSGQAVKDSELEQASLLLEAQQAGVNDSGELSPTPHAEAPGTAAAAAAASAAAAAAASRASSVAAMTVTSRHGIILYFVSFSFGLATSESMLYVTSMSHNPTDAMRMAIARVVFSLPMHAACGVLTGLGLIERYLGSGLSLYNVLLPSVLLHGSYDFCLLLFRLVPVVGLAQQQTADYAKYAVSLFFLVQTAALLRRRLEVYFHNSEK